MPLHIEINGDCSPREWEALAALIAVMRSNAAPKSIGKITVDVEATVPKPPADAEVPKPPVETAAPTPSASDALIEAAAAAKAPAAPTPTPTPAATTAPAEGAELDKDGVPWDARIHVSTKTKNVSGEWRRKRGTSDALFEAVTAELKSIMAATPETPATPAEVPAEPAAAANTDPAAAFGGAAPAAAPPPPPETPAETTPAGAMTDFARIMKLVVEKQTAGSLTTEMTSVIAQQLGLTGVKDLALRPDLIPQFEASLPA